MDLIFRSVINKHQLEGIGDMNRAALSVVMLMVVGLVFGVSSVAAQTVYSACTWDTSSIFKDAAGKEKFERRFYVSTIVSMTKEEFLKVDREGGRMEGLCGDYIEKTVKKAADERGERVDPGGQLKIHRGMELSGEDAGRANVYKFATKEEIQKKLDADISEMKDADRFILKFNWDTTGKSEAADLANEKKRTIPTPKPTN